MTARLLTGISCQVKETQVVVQFKVGVINGRGVLLQKLVKLVNRKHLVVILCNCSGLGSLENIVSSQSLKLLNF